MANGIGLSDGVLLLATVTEGVLGKGDPVLFERLSSTEREESCLTEARSFSGTVSPALHRDSSASYLQKYVHVHMYMYMCVCVCVCVCERERERERESPCESCVNLRLKLFCWSCFGHMSLYTITFQ